MTFILQKMAESEIQEWLQEKYPDTDSRHTSFVLSKRQHEHIINQIESGVFDNAKTKHVIKKKKLVVMCANPALGTTKQLVRMTAHEVQDALSIDEATYTCIKSKCTFKHVREQKSDLKLKHTCTKMISLIETEMIVFLFSSCMVGNNFRTVAISMSFQSRKYTISSTILIEMAVCVFPRPKAMDVDITILTAAGTITVCYSRPTLYPTDIDPCIIINIYISSYLFSVCRRVQDCCIPRAILLSCHGGAHSRCTPQNAGHHEESKELTYLYMETIQRIIAWLKIKLSAGQKIIL